MTTASSWYQAVKVPCTPYEPADARKLVAASGVPNPTLHLLLRSSDTDEQRLVQFIQAEEAAVGISVVIESGSDSGGNFEAETLASPGAGGGDPDPNLYSRLTTNGTRNTPGYSNPRLDLILENARKALSSKARQVLYRTAQQIILADRPLVYLYYPIRYAGFDASRVTGVQLNPDGLIRVAFAQFK